jgi:nucleoid-associated protein YgaU
MFVYMAKQTKAGFFKSREDVISMFLGLVVVISVVGFIVNFIEKRKGSVDVPVVSNDIKLEETKNIEEQANKVQVVVEKNDSLWKIAVRTYGDGYKWTDIAKANEIKNPNVIEVGQKLALPNIEKNEAGVKLEKTEYTVMRGDNLWSISVKLYGNGYRWTEIWRDNRSKLNSPDRLEIGMKLLVYGRI